MENLLIIDGYNCMRRVNVFEEALDRSLESARLEFLNVIKEFERKNRAYSKIIVVFDGKAGGVQQVDRRGCISVIFSRDGESGDDLIIRLLEKYAGQWRISVVSDDNYVRNHTRVYGADAIRCADFIKRAKSGDRRKTRGRDEKDLDPRTVLSINEELKKVWRLTN